MSEKNFIVKGQLETRETVQLDSDTTIDGALTVTGSANITGNLAFGDITSGNVPAANLTGTIDSARIPPLSASDISPAETFDSANIPKLQASDIVGGEFDSARIPILTSADVQKLAASDVTTGTFDSARIPGLGAADIVGGTLDSARIPGLAGADIVTGTIDSARIPALNASDVGGGTFAVARIPELALGTNTSGNYVQSVTAGLGIQSLSAASEGTEQTIKVDSSFVTGLFSATEGISYSGGVIGIDTTDSVTFVNITAGNEFRIKDSANGDVVGDIEGSKTEGMIFHAHAHQSGKGMKFVIHDTQESDYLIINKDSGLNFTGRRLRNLAEPTQASDAATKSYVDAVSEGLHVHAPARVATTQTLVSDAKIASVTYDNGTAGVGATLSFSGSLDSIDGVTLTTNDRLIIKNEANQTHNGIYVWNNASQITRADDFDTPAEIAGGDFIFTQEGTLNGGIGFAQTKTITSAQLGDSAIVFAQFSGAENITAGAGLSKTGNTLNAELSANGGLKFNTAGDAGTLEMKLADSSLEVTSQGLRVKQTQGGIAVEHLDLNGEAFSGATAFTLANVLNATSETLDNLDAYDGDSNQYFTQARADSAIGKFVSNHVDSDYIQTRKPTTAVFNISPAADFQSWRFSGDGFPDSEADPSVTLVPGQTYKFNVTGNTGTPFVIQKVSGAYSASDILSTDSGINTNTVQNTPIFYTVPFDNPPKLYYVASTNANMAGVINFASAHDSAKTQGQIDSSVGIQIDSALNNDITGTANEIEVTTSGGKAVVGLVDAVQIATSLTVNGNAVLTTADEGTGNGIDADTVDGLEAAAFLRSGATDAYTSGTLTFNNGTTLTAADGATVNFSMADGTAPFTVTSTTNVPNLNASTLSGLASTAFLRSGATDAYTSGTLTFNSGTTLTAAAGATVNFSNTTGTAPFTVASTTVVSNLNADQLDGQHGAYYRIDILDSAGTTLNP